MLSQDPNDPSGLIAESFKIDGIFPEQCRSIFLDWALSIPADQDTKARIDALLAQYAPANPEHPMTLVLREGLLEPARSGRRGGRSARLS